MIDAFGRCEILLKQRRYSVAEIGFAINDRRVEPFKQRRVRLIEKAKRFVKIPTVYVKLAVDRKLDNVTCFFKLKIVPGFSDINKPYIVITVGRSKSPCSAARFDSVQDSDVLIAFKFFQFFL